MRVVQVTPRYPPRTGGVETHVREVSERLRERGHRVTVVTADARRGLRTDERVGGVDVVRHRGLAPGGAFHVAPGILSTVRRLDADVVHAHNYHSLPLLFAALAAGDATLVVTPHYHGGSASGVRDALLSLYRFPGGWALGRADAVVAVSEWERDRLETEFGIDVAAVVPNGLDVERFATAAPERRDRPYLLCIGRLESYKGVQHVVRALPELPAYDLVVAGAGPYRDTLERLARERGVADRTSFLGFVDADRVPGLYAGAAAHVTLSSFEAYGMTVAESLAAGTPCVIRRAGALREWARREDCVGVREPTPERVAGAVESAVGRATSSEGLLTWDEVTDELETRYRELLPDPEQGHV
jgi:glycosyltransferase involved in cell wall biosynthesis